MAENSVRVLCVGGAGFIGSHLSHRLSGDERFDVAQADIWSAKLKIRFENKPFAFHHIDIEGDDQGLDALIAQHDVVLNLASKASPQLYVQDPVGVVKLNLFAGYKVIEACVRQKKKLIHFSTSEVYGKSLGSTDPFTEDETNCVTGPIKNHRWIYSSTKQLIDRLIYAHGAYDGLDFTIVRPFNVIGPLIDHVMTGQDDGSPRVFSHFMSALINAEPLRLVDGGHSRRTFLHVDDLVGALVAILERPAETKGQILNIGNPGNEVTIARLAELMSDLFYEKFDPAAARSPITTVSSREFYGEGFEDTDRRMPDIGKMEALGWSPQIGLPKLLEDTMSYTWENRHRLTTEAMDAHE